MTCSPKYEFGLFGSLFFVAVVISSILFTPLADKVGRRRVCMCGLALAAVTQTIILFSTSRQFTYVLIFMLGIAMPMRVFVGYIYAMEFLPSEKTTFVSALVLGIDGFMMGVSALWFMLISNNWKTIFTFATILVYVSFALVCSMPESPKFLVTQGRYNEARQVMTKIAKVNGISEFEYSKDEAKSLSASNDLNQKKFAGAVEPLEYTCKWVQEVA